MIFANFDLKGLIVLDFLFKVMIFCLFLPKSGFEVTIFLDLQLKIMIFCLL